MHPSVLEILRELGLPAPERQVYLACLAQSNGLFAFQVAAESKIKRTSVDLVLDRLIDRGFVTRGKQGKRYKYFAEPPLALLTKQESLANRLREALPMLAALRNKETAASIRFFQGREGIRQINDDIHATMKNRPDKEQLRITSGTHFNQIWHDIPKTIIKRRLKAGYAIRLIASAKASSLPGWDTNEGEKRSVRYFDEEKFPFNAVVDIYGDKIAVYSLVKPNNGVILQNKQIALSLASIFELLWTSLPDISPASVKENAKGTGKRKDKRK